MPPQRGAAWDAVYERARAARSFSQNFTRSARHQLRHAVNLAEDILECEIRRAVLDDHHHINAVRKQLSMRAKRLSNKPFCAISLHRTADFFRRNNAESALLTDAICRDQQRKVRG